MENTLVIIGGGPAGLTAGIYALRAGIKTSIIEKTFPGGNMLLTEKIENYPGFPEGISGIELAENMRRQYLQFGGELINGEVKNISFEDNRKVVYLSDGSETKADAIIIASGSSKKKIGVEGEDKYTGRGVSFCAICDGALFKGKKVAVIGGGNSALEEAIYLTRYAERCYLVHRRDTFRASAYLQEKLKQYPLITLLLSRVVRKIEGDGEKVKALVLENKGTGAIETIEVDGVFISVGQRPNVDFINGKIEQNPSGYIITDYKMQTSINGVFACGDVIRKSLYQIITACSEGAIAATSAERYLSSQNI
ncbi:MAG: thioredoxin-disulfide reductase [Candidatus Ratteibacteria bacterium]|nr:thioredoxin-disulfide reductase [Candidatus Ratteibacteria bacterium]